MSGSDTYDCPLCPRECKTRDHLRDHLEEEHRKMAIVDAYLGALGR